MNKQKIYPALAVVVSALAAFISLAQINFYTGWIAFVPLFVYSMQRPPLKNFRFGLLFGASFSVFAYSWMITGAERFTGYSFLYGLGIMLLCTLCVALYWGSLLFCISILKRKNKSIAAIFLNSIIAAAVCCLFEFLLSFVAQGFPWFGFYAGNAMLDNIYSIQPAALLGSSFLSFVVIVVNYLIAAFIFLNQWKQLYIPISVIIVYLLGGYCIQLSFVSTLEKDKPLTIALIAENILPDIKWDDNNGDALVQHLLQLDAEAAAQKPNIIVWSESAIPWTYRADDDLVKEILRLSKPANATHILGINTEVKENVVNNSAYAIQPDGNISGRYDKQYLLSLIEAPLVNISIPFFSSKGFWVNKDEKHNLPLNTPYGEAGIMICNESSVSAAALHAADNDANFLCNMSNDGWFNKTYIVRHHFYRARLSAVETRKDMAVNSNNGYSGFINAAGEIVDKRRDTGPFVLAETIQANNYKSMATKCPYIFIISCTLFISVITLMKIFKK